MKTYLPFFLGLWLITGLSCTTPPSKNPPTKVDDQPGILTFSTQDMDFLDGCGCYFGFDSLSFVKGEYLLLQNYDGQCRIKVNNQEQILKSKDEIQTIYPESNHFGFQNEEFELTVDLLDLGRNGDETSLYQGKMTLRSKSTKEQITTEIYGECGC